MRRYAEGKFTLKLPSHPTTKVENPHVFKQHCFFVPLGYTFKSLTENLVILANGYHFQIRHSKIDAGAKFQPDW